LGGGGVWGGREGGGAGQEKEEKRPPGRESRKKKEKEEIRRRSVGGEKREPGPGKGPWPALRREKEGLKGKIAGEKTGGKKGSEKGGKGFQVQGFGRPIKKKKKPSRVCVTLKRKKGTPPEEKRGRLLLLWGGGKKKKDHSVTEGKKKATQGKNVSSWKHNSPLPGGGEKGCEPFRKEKVPTTYLGEKDRLAKEKHLLPQGEGKKLPPSC